jgi:membrane-bound lytic murein transglycosylase D
VKQSTEEVDIGMGFTSGSRTTAILVALVLFAGVLPASAFARAQQKTETQTVIDRAEENFKRGEEAMSKGLPEIGRRMFDNAVDVVLQSGVDLRSDPKLDSYYRSLLERIHKYEARPDDKHALQNQDDPDRPEVSEPAVLDELSEIKDEELAATTPEGVHIYGKYDFDFTVAPPVFQFVNFFSSGRGRSTMEAGLQRSGRYRQMVEKIFKEEKVPLDLMWLAQAESVWRPSALSRAAAKGLWQFIPSTGQRYGLAQTTWIDDRSNPEKSTRGAARYLRWLNEHFAGDWLLAMAAYNSGENRVDGAISKCGYADFWELYRRGLLPQETRNYVPIILSIVIISKNQNRYGFDVKADPPLNYESFELPSQTDLKVIADLLGIPYEVMQDLNPELRRGASPAGQPYVIKIPKGFKKQLEVAYADLPEEKRIGRRVSLPADDVAEASRPAYRVQLASHTVRRGETLASIARKNRISVKELARVNRISSRGTLRKGQTIRIPQQIRLTRDRRGRLVRSKSGRYTEVKASRSRRRTSARKPSRSRSTKTKTSHRRR